MNDPLKNLKKIQNYRIIHQILQVVQAQVQAIQVVVLNHL